MYTEDFPSCCNAKIFYDLDGITATQVSQTLRNIRGSRNNLVVAITADHQQLDRVMKAGGFRCVGKAKRHKGHITLWAWLRPMPKKAKKKATKRARR